MDIEWVCKKCTYRNAHNGSLCDMCGTSKEGKTWACPTCTFLNLGGSACTMCMTPKPRKGGLPKTGGGRGASQIQDIWEWEEGGIWKAYDDETITEIENARKAGKPLVNLTKGFFGRSPGMYNVNISLMFQTNSRTGYQRKVRRNGSSASVAPKPAAPAPRSSLFGGFKSYMGMNASAMNAPKAPQPSQKSFVDPDKIFAKDKDDRRKEEEKAKFLYNIFEKLTKNPDNYPLVINALDDVHKALDHEWKANKTEEKECQICYAADLDDPNEAVTISPCGCRMCCKDCIKAYLKNKLKSEEFTPWIPCPGENCDAPIDIKTLIAAGVEHDSMQAFCYGYLKKMLSRFSAFIPCKRETCDFGFLIPGESVNLQMICQKCGMCQQVSKGLEQDDSVKEMLKSGLLRECPKCKFPQMKDKGLCNVMQCGKCAIWWNWRTRDYGQNSKELKNKARKRGTLWEPGELDYQRRLERSDPRKFKQLLERNGIHYDPNYMRGGWS